MKLAILCSALLFSFEGLIAKSANAQCDLRGFDQSAPKALKGTVDNAEGKFTWASDYDEREGRNWVWNYIKNDDVSRSLYANWEKATISIPYINPLPAGEAYCNEYPVNNIDENSIDDESPIYYGNRNIKQNAVIYIKKEYKESKLGYNTSEIRTSYLRENGEMSEVNFTFFYAVEEGKVSEVGFIIGEEYSILVDDILENWSPKAIDALVVHGKQLGVSVEAGQWFGYLRQNPSVEETFGKVFGLEGSFLRSAGTVKGTGPIGDYGGVSNVKVFLVSENNMPVASGIIELPRVK